jgi:hypothetical protein
MAVFLLVVIVAIALGIIGAVVHGMVYLLVIAVLLFIAAVAVVAVRSARRPRPLR